VEKVPLFIWSAQPIPIIFLHRWKQNGQPTHSSRHLKQMGTSTLFHLECHSSPDKYLTFSFTRHCTDSQVTLLSDWSLCQENICIYHPAACTVSGRQLQILLQRLIAIMTCARNSLMISKRNTLERGKYRLRSFLQQAILGISATPVSQCKGSN